MKTLILLAVTHRKEIPALGEMIAGRAYTIDGVTDAEVLKPELAAVPVLSVDQLQAEGFTMQEISLGAQDVERG